MHMTLCPSPVLVRDMREDAASEGTLMPTIVAEETVPPATALLFQTLQRALDLIPAQSLPDKAEKLDALLRNLHTVREGVKRELHRAQQRTRAFGPSRLLATEALPQQRGCSPGTVPLAALQPEVQLVEGSLTADEPWAQVLGRRQRRRQNREAAWPFVFWPVAFREPAGDFASAIWSRSNKRRRPPRSAAVTITCVGETASYADVLREARREDLHEHGVSRTRLCRARTRGYLLEIPGKEGDAKADSVASTLRQV